MRRQEFSEQDPIGRDSEPSSFQKYLVDIKEPNYVEQLIHMLNEYGFATFENVTSDDELIALAKNFGDIVLHRDSDGRGITQVAPKAVDPNLTSTLGFTDQELILHTDGSAMGKPAKFLALYCKVPAEEGGITSLLDGKKLFTALQHEDPELLKKMQNPNSALFGNPNGDFYRGSIFSEDSKSVISSRFRADNAGYYVAPLAVDLDKLIRIMDKHAVKFNLKEGQGYIVNNARAFHARTAFSGYREMHRVLINEAPNLHNDPTGRRIDRGFRLPR